MRCTAFSTTSAIVFIDTMLNITFNVTKLLAIFGILLQQQSIANGRSPKLSLVNNYNANDPALYEEFNDLLAKYKPLNFGLGIPDFNPPKIVQNALAKAAVSDDYKFSQYAVNGHPRLLKALSDFYSMLLNRTLNPEKNIAITVGANEALYNIFQAYTNPGDEWIIFEPCYPRYISMIKAAHGVPRYITLIPNNTTRNIKSADFKFDQQDLAGLFNDKTKGIIVNSPHNPLGKIFNHDELSYIAELAQKWDVLVVFDEVYQFLNYDNAKHLRLATFPGMFERTISVGSAGKMFAATGYRIGWAYGAEDVITNIKLISGVAVVSAPTPSQEAIAVGIEEELKNYEKSDSFIAQFRRENEAKRNYLYDILRNSGMTPIFPAGGFYITADWTTMFGAPEIIRDKNVYADYSFVRSSVKNLNFFALPLSRTYGYDNTHIGQKYLRFTLVKNNDTIEEFDRLVKKWNCYNGDE